MKDINGVEIKAGDRLRHTAHGGICRVCEPGTDGFLSQADNLILIPDDLPHRTGLAWVLNEKRAAKGEVIR